MSVITRTTDPKGRVSLPKAFAGTTVLIETISDTELRIRKAKVVPEDDLRFREETATVLSDRDRDRFLSLLERRPAANAALRQAASEYGKRKQPLRKRRRG